MEALLSALQSAFNLSARNGWIMLAFGGSMVTLIMGGVIPLEKADSGLLLLFTALSVLGLVILIIHLASWIIGNVRASAADASARAKQDSKIEKFLNEGTRNLDVLDQRETQSLVWVLRAGKQRFRADDIANSWGPGGLLRKKIIHPDPGTSATDVWMVNQRVWDVREALLKEHSGVPTAKDPPW